MVAVRDSVFDGKCRPNTLRSERLGLPQNHQHIGNVFQRLEEKGFEDAPFAVVSIDSGGNVQLHASRQVKGFLDEQLFTSKFEEAHKLSLQQPCDTSSAASSPDQSSVSQRTSALHIIEDELTQPQQTSSRATSRSLLRTARQRERLTFLRELSPISPPYPAPALPEASPVMEERSVVFRNRVSKSFRIDSKMDVTAYLESRLKRLQQLAGKKIAKAWIKGICPKKQARFPYRNKKRCEETNGEPRIPGWWPQEKGVCPFKEPDHIRREERMKLCLHLLRLRPTPQQLRAWNDETTEHNKTHVSRGWTAFLEELAGPDLFDDLPREAPNRVQLRRTLLAQMYEVAALEEQFDNGEVDGDTLHVCEPDEGEERKPTLTKRSRRSSVCSSVGDHSRQSSVSASAGRVKRVRQSVEHALDQHDSGFELDSEMVETRALDQEQPLHWNARPDPSHLNMDISMAPALPQGDVQPSSSMIQSPWVSVQPHPAPAQIPATFSGDAAFASSELPVSMISRKRALRAQRKLQANQLSDSFNHAVLVKQETHPSMPQPHDQMPTWDSSNGNRWIDTMTSFCSPQEDPSVVSTAYSIPQQRFSEPQRYIHPQYANNNMDNSSQNSIFDNQIYPGHGMMESQACMTPNCCAQLEAGVTHTAMPMSSGGYMLSGGQETSPLNMQQPRALESWQDSGMPERHMQSHHEPPNFYYSDPGQQWDNRC